VRRSPTRTGNSQNLDVLLGKSFRLDAGDAAPEPEIVAYGLRNPWRFSFDPAGNIVVGDVGWNMRRRSTSSRAAPASRTSAGASTRAGRGARTRRRN